MKQWAEILRAIADGKEVRVAKTDTPLPPQEVLKLIASNTFSEDPHTSADFRICEPSIIVNGQRCPAPCSEPLADGDTYFVPCVTDNGGAAAGPYVWGVNRGGDTRRLELGMVYTERANAIERARRMLQFSRG